MNVERIQAKTKNVTYADELEFMVFLAFELNNIYGTLILI